MKYNLKDISSIKVNESKNVDFNEYCFLENNEPALIWPTNCSIEKLSEDSLYFNIDFRNLSCNTHYINKRGHFDIELKSLLVKILINYKDVIGDSIVYKF